MFTHPIDTFLAIPEPMLCNQQISLFSPNRPIVCYSYRLMSGCRGKVNYLTLFLGLFSHFALAETPHTCTNTRLRTNRVVKTQHNPTRPMCFLLYFYLICHAFYGLVYGFCILFFIKVEE